MKLRIKGDSIRLRVSRSELQRLRDGQVIEETVHFPGGDLRYALGSSPQIDATTASFRDGRITLVISSAELAMWLNEQEVGIYTSIPTAPDRQLEITIEKDFACLDRSDEDNSDTFVNPHSGVAC
ncbi:hypothetical protein [Terriglobus sp. TAA 43]|uniref:DUF7009 family protein n=1 Tax=Terriglobus sp. TAA 43 TaxID=278961 RepID=UPI00064627ED|nr:hypothetical protein [Terriglobus sp. TAA 43]